MDTPIPEYGIPHFLIFLQKLPINGSPIFLSSQAVLWPKKLMATFSAVVTD